ncbi:MAG: response regulator [Nitrospirae bacterium]|nr:response regulator [Nitrospirota bacterium]
MWANIGKALLKDGFALRPAAGRQEALRELGRQEYEIIITGLKLEDSTGLQVLRDIKQSAPLSEIIVLTESPSQDTKWEALKIGAFDYLSTPVEEYQIRDVARKALMHRNLRVNFREGGMGSSESPAPMIIPPPSDDLSAETSPAPAGTPRAAATPSKPSAPVWDETMRTAPPPPEPFTMAQEEGKFTFWWKEDDEAEAPAPRATLPPSGPVPAVVAPPLTIEAVQEPVTTAQPPPSVIPPEPLTAPPSVQRDASEILELKQEIDDLQEEVSKLRRRNRELEPMVKVKLALESEIETLKARQQADALPAAKGAGKPEEKNIPFVSTRISPKSLATSAVLAISVAGLSYFAVENAQWERRSVTTQKQVDQLQQQFAAVQSSFDRLADTLPRTVAPDIQALPRVSEPAPAIGEAAPPPKPPEPAWSDLATETPLGLPKGMAVTTSKTRLRSGPGIEHDLVEELGPGVLLRISKEAGEWLDVETEGGERGFVWTPNTGRKAISAQAQPGERARKVDQGGFAYISLAIGVRSLGRILPSDLRYRATFLKGGQPWETVDLSPPDKAPGPFALHRLDLFCPRGLRKADLGADLRVQLLAAPPEGDFELLQEFPLLLK